ncbi:MAG: hypothetical protein ACTSRG_06385 [Candidatus Helarchaeota archaeon]
MQILETDPQTFVGCYPPNFPQQKYFLMNALSNNDDKSVKLFILKNGSICGRVMAFIDPRHKSFGKKVGSFGWLYAKKPEQLRFLLTEVEEYFKSSGKNIIRGPRNDPVVFGGQGVLAFGFNQPELFGLPENPPWYGAVLRKNGYNFDTQYYCIRWTAPYTRWTDKEDPEIQLVNLNFDEIMDRAEQIANLYNSCMLNMPDVTALDKKSLIDSIEFFKIIKAGDFLFFALCNDEVVGLAVLIPNIFDIWAGRPVQNVNWYIADVNKKYQGRYIFSKMKNSVIKLLEKKNIPAYEGTYIWDKNKRMLDICLRLGKLVRRHLVYTKKLNGGKK